MLLTIIIFLFVLGLLVFVHEAGHFFAARSVGVKVEEFGFGFPPRIFGLKRGETLYSLNWIPLGGFVKIFGEKGEGKHDKRSFAHCSILARSWIVSAGVIMNFVLAFLILSVGFMVGLPSALEDGVEVGGKVCDETIRIVAVLKGAPGEQQGVHVGDALVSLDNQTFQTIPEVQEYINARVGQNVEVAVKRGGELLSFTIAPQILQETSKGGIGVGLARVGIVSYSFPTAFVKGAQATIMFTREILSALYTLVKNFVGKGVISTDLSGPVGVAVMTGQAAAMGLAYLLQFVALLSINLAIINFLPFPALDGGRVVFFMLEAVRRRPVHEKLEAMVHNVGFILLMVLVLLVTYRDIARWGGKFLQSIGL